MKGRLRKKLLKKAWMEIAEKLPAVLPTRKIREQWVSLNVNFLMRDRRNAKRGKKPGGLS